MKFKNKEQDVNNCLKAIEVALKRPLTEIEKKLFYSVEKNFVMMGVQPVEYGHFTIARLWLYTTDKWLEEDIKNGIGYVLAFNSVDPKCSELGSEYINPYTKVLYDYAKKIVGGKN